MYVVTEDYYNVISTEDLEAALYEGRVDLNRVERIAIREVSGYLRKRYRIASEFKKKGDDRNDYIVMIVIDCVLFHLFSGLPGRITDGDVRKIRYDAAKKWLREVRNGDTDPEIPSISDSESGGGDPEQNPDNFHTIRWDSKPKQDNDW